MLELVGRQRELACGGLNDVDQISLEFHRRDPVMTGWRDGEVIVEAVNENRAERLASTSRELSNDTLWGRQSLVQTQHIDGAVAVGCEEVSAVGSQLEVEHRAGEMADDSALSR